MLIPNKLTITLLFLLTSGISSAQFLDTFDENKINRWFFFTGDGKAEMDFVQMDGFARILVDATKDQHNVWWAIIKRDVTSSLDLNKLRDTTYQLRVEAKVRLSNAPRRINFMVNTNRTTNFHIDLMEYDIPDTSDWHIISMTTKRFDALPGDTVYVQLGVTDWGIGKYYVDVDYYRADIVNVNEAEPDKGILIPYHPPVPELSTFADHLPVSQDAVINSDFPDVNFNNWSDNSSGKDERILTVNGNQWIVLRWDLTGFRNSEAKGSGVLELTTHSLFKGGNYIDIFGEEFGIEFGKVRVIEITGGDSEWDQEEVTFNNLLEGKDYSEIFNTQMIFDFEVVGKPGSKNFITLSNPVLQRLLEGKTKGLLLRPLGAVNASFYASENLNSPRLHFNIK